MADGAIGFVRAGITLGLASLSTSPKRGFSDLQTYITLEETHQDDIDITDHPIEQGAVISDHATKRPAELTIKIAWSNSTPAEGVDGIASSLLVGVSGLAQTPGIIQSSLLGKSTNQVTAIYQKLLALQAARKPFDVYTGKRVYTSMLLKSIMAQTDKSTENVLSVTLTLRQVVIVSTQLIASAAPRSAQASPSLTLGATSAGTKQLINNPSAYVARSGNEAINAGRRGL